MRGASYAWSIAPSQAERAQVSPGSSLTFAGMSINMEAPTNTTLPLNVAKPLALTFYDEVRQGSPAV